MAITLVPFELTLIIVLLKPQVGVVFKLKLTDEPDAVGVPVAVNTTNCSPVAVKVPDPENVTPLIVVVV